MRKTVKNEICSILRQLEDVNEALLQQNGTVLNQAALSQEQVQPLLTECQEAAVALGEKIEAGGAEGQGVVRLLEEYCEKLYQLCINWEKAAARSTELKNVRSILQKAQEAVVSRIPDDKLEVVFLPYKASMWDSMESVWMAAEADEKCNASVIPIPYYDKQPDGALTKEHYEAELYPDYVPIVDYREYDFEKRKPDVIFIHNPYDGMNFVTTVHPFFYSDHLKKFTRCLVYIPYYATAGGMSEAQSLCPAYIHADYIVIQAEKYKNYFDPCVPKEKLLAFGSPKFDSVIHKCQNPPAAPEGWTERMQGRKVYFYNTSLNGMLENTENFLKKMNYVFRTFEGRQDACLLWRPHPLLEATFQSLRKEYWEQYQALKEEFLKKDLGIFDTSPDIETAIAYADAYVGDAGTSVTALFGVAGKPLFILDNRIHSLPKEEDWKGLVYYMPSYDHQDQYAVVYGNKLYAASNRDFQYEFYCDLSEYTGGSYYIKAYRYGDTVYVFPQNAEHILAIGEDRKPRKICFPHECEQRGAFVGIVAQEDAVWILPNRYSSLIRFDPATERLTFITGVRDFNCGLVDGEYAVCARFFEDGKLFFFNTTGTQLLTVDCETLETEVTDTGLDRPIMSMISESREGEVFWLLSFTGTEVIRWNRRTGEKREYDLSVEGLKSFSNGQGAECDKRYFCSIALTEQEAVFVPLWANYFVRLELESGKAEKWDSPFMEKDEKNAYFPTGSIGGFIRDKDDYKSYRFYFAPERKTYDIDLETRKIREITMSFDRDEVREHAPGFSVDSQWMQYGCTENAFHTLRDFLDGSLPGMPFDRKKQLAEFSKINASVDGCCGERVYAFIKEKL